MAYWKSMPRGVRNNNPLNIRESEGDRTQWKGESVLNIDKAFEEFKHPVYGFRAGARILRSYHRQGFRTLRDVIYRFAPPEDNNDTELYIQQVSKWSGIRRNQMIDVTNTEQMAKLLHAMSRKEVGSYFGLNMARDGVMMA
ncbi:virion protein [Photobacterium proteolyticum]|uniref:Virion protein n=1 Tax=Photobacterium proteolyticum TaxID=1903952 RepID=A0A1Q9G7P5_9GAMM|nr:virion protein [Photobacterium proteolyticum]OLQ70322.1 virion protein [Photobacterium proteolyticum]